MVPASEILQHAANFKKRSGSFSSIRTGFTSAIGPLRSVAEAVPFCIRFFRALSFLSLAIVDLS